jgi:hypothetical protein
LLRLRPGDLVFATSDHGFIELYPDAAATVSHADLASNQVTFADAVFYRYTKQFKPSAISAAAVVEAGSELHYLVEAAGTVV